MRQTEEEPIVIEPAENNPQMLKRNMMYEEINGTPCEHSFYYSGRIPMTGVVLCYMCGATKWRGNRPALY